MGGEISSGKVVGGRKEAHGDNAGPARTVANETRRGHFLGVTMRVYYIIVPVTRATGRQFWRVNAESESDAMAQYLLGTSLFEGEELEVQETGDPEISTDGP